MRKLSIAALLLCAACSAAPEPETAPSPQAAADPRIGELQTMLTELLERIDVLNDRINKLESGVAVAAAPAVASAPGQEVPAARPAPELTGGFAAVATPSAPQEPAQAAQQPALVGARIAEDYRQAIMLYGKGRHGDARKGFQAVFDADPSGDLADNALFWIGETYFAGGDFTNAMRYYNRVVNEFSEQNKAPDALFKTALALERTGDLALARRTLQQVIQRYPYSSPASSAKAELERIKY